MRLPACILQKIMELPEGTAISFTVHTDGREEWTWETKERQRRGQNMNLVDMSLFVDLRGVKKVS